MGDRRAENVLGLLLVSLLFAVIAVISALIALWQFATGNNAGPAVFTSLVMAGAALAFFGLMRYDFKRLRT